MSARVIEGVSYYPFVVRWLEKGKRRELTLWSPGRPWLAEEVERALIARDVPAGTPVTVRPKREGKRQPRRTALEAAEREPAMPEMAAGDPPVTRKMIAYWASIWDLDAAELERRVRAEEALIREKL